MSYISNASAVDFETYRTNLHNSWETPRIVLNSLLRNWGLEDIVIGERDASGEASEVYRLFYHTSDNSSDLYGFLRIAHHGHNPFEVALMRACEEARLPAVRLLHERPVSASNGREMFDYGVTILSPAVGRNFGEAYEMGLLTQDFGMKLIENSARFLCQIHDLSQDDWQLRKLGLKNAYQYEPELVYEELAKCRANVGDRFELLAMLDELELRLPAVVDRLTSVIEELEPVVLHFDFDMKHLYFDEQTGEITSLIDFGGAKAGYPHLDLLHWKTFSSATFEVLLDNYLNLRIGKNEIDRQEFKHELDAFDVIYQVAVAASRSTQGLRIEVQEHLSKALDACDRIVQPQRVRDFEIALQGLSRQIYPRSFGLPL